MVDVLIPSDVSEVCSRERRAVIRTGVLPGATEPRTEVRLYAREEGGPWVELPGIHIFDSHAPATAFGSAFARDVDVDPAARPLTTVGV